MLGEAMDSGADDLLQHAATWAEDLKSKVQQSAMELLRDLQNEHVESLKPETRGLEGARK